MNLIDRKTAQAEGVKFYFTGKPCLNGLHVEWNLRPVPRVENRRKHNRLDAELALSQS
jgi:hypothetical protein